MTSCPTVAAGSSSRRCGRDMESRLGHDFGDVRVHNNGQAHDSAVAVNAHAYTVDPNIVFQRDRYDPSSTAGQVTLAHELTHVVQQRTGRWTEPRRPAGSRSATLATDSSGKRRRTPTG